METTHRPTFGALLRRRRQGRGLTQEGLAELAELSVRELAYLERGKHLPRPGTARRLIDALDLADEDRALLLTAAGAEISPWDRSEGRTVKNLPAQPNRFIGREREIVAVANALDQDEVRLVTLTGPGGTGKTRLAIEVARKVLDAFPDGVVFVPLASVADANLVPSAIATGLGTKETAGPDILDSLVEVLRGRRLLLILDNLEHVLSAAHVVAHLLGFCPQLKVVVTSRAVLHLSAEHEYPVAPLAVPAGPSRLALEALAGYDAVRLFVQRSRAVAPDFELTEEHAELVAEICRRVDGLPLAIELAAARLRLFPPRALLARLSNRLQLLTGGPRDLPARQQTLRSTIDWSHHLLPPDQQRIFARLAVFAGGSALHAVEAVCESDGDMDLLAGLTSLIEQSLLRQEGTDEPRFTMLETIREYAWERLIERGDAEDARERHARYFLSMVEDAEQMRDTPEAARAVRRLEADHDNLRNALAWCTAEPRMGETALRLAAALGWFWEQGAHWNEGHRWLEDVLVLPAASDRPHAWALALTALAELEFVRANHAAARVRAEQAVALWQSLRDARGLARAVSILGSIRTHDADREGGRQLLAEAVDLWRSVGDARLMSRASLGLGMAELHQGNLAAGRAQLEENLEADRAILSPFDLVQRLRMLRHVAYRQGDTTAGQRYADEAVSTARSIDDPQEAQRALCALGWTAGACGDFELAQVLLEESLALARRTGQSEGPAGLSWMTEGPTGISWLLNHLGDAARGLGDDVRASALYRESLALFEEQGHVQGRAASFHNLAHLALTRGDLQLAKSLFANSLRSFHSIGFSWCVADCLAGLAGVASHEGAPERAATLFGAAEAIHRSIDLSGMFVQRVNEASHERDIALAQSQVDGFRWSRAWEAGRAMRLEEAVAHALAASPSRDSN